MTTTTSASSSADDAIDGGMFLFCGGTDFDNLAKRAPKKGSAEFTLFHERLERFPDLPGPTRFQSLLDVDVAFVASGSTAQHCIIVDTSGSAYVFGRNHFGQLGLGDQKQRMSPVPLQLSGKVISASCGKSHTLLAMDDGRALSAGSNRFGQLGTGSCLDSDEDFSCTFIDVSINSSVTKVKAGADFSMWIAGGRLYSAGNGERGQLGDGNEHVFNSSSSSIKMMVESQPNPSRVHVPGRVLNVACGPIHALATTENDGVVAVYSWGCGDYGRLGHGIQKDLLKPLKLSIGQFGRSMTLPETTMLACGGTSSMLSTGNVTLCWGKLKSSGDAIMEPLRFDDLQGWNVRSISFSNSTFGVAADTSTIVWGNASHGELGGGPTGKKSSAAPQLCRPLEGCNTIQVECGNGFTVFVVDTSDDIGQKRVDSFPLYNIEALESVTEKTPVKSVASKKKVAAKRKGSTKKKTSSKKRK